MMKYLSHRFACLFCLGALLFWLASACSQETVRNQTSLKQSSDECRTVEHILGKTCIPIHPQRVVTLWTNIFADTLALGIEPIATAYLGDSFDEYLQDYLQDKGITSKIEIVGDIRSPSLEKILQLNPDLILTNSWAEKNYNSYNKLSRIAPTVVLDFPEPLERDWKKMLKDLAVVLGKTEEFNQLMDQYNQRVENLKQALGDRRHELQISVANASPQFGIWVYGEKHPVGRVLNDVGLQRPPSQRGDFYYIDNISEEVLSMIDGDVLFMLTSRKQDSQEMLARLRKKPLWQQLKAFQSNKIYFVNEGHWHSWDYLSINAVIDDLFKYLVKEDTDQA